MFALFADESEKGLFLGVGGYYVSLDRVFPIEEKWRQLKTALGLAPEDEIKWTLPQGHPTRVKFESNGRSTKELCEQAISLVAAMNLVIVLSVMKDIRKANWYQVWRKRPVPRDFYCEGLKYVLQRFAEEAQQVVQPTSPPFVCVVDRPGTSKEPAGPVRTVLTATTIRLGENAVLDLHREAFHSGPGEGPARRGNSPLRSVSFHSGLLIGAASHNDALQIADIIVGCVTSWVSLIDRAKADTWLVDRVKLLVPRFRGGTAAMFGNGFVLHPPDSVLWNSLYQSVR